MTRFFFPGHGEAIKAGFHKVAKGLCATFVLYNWTALAVRLLKPGPEALADRLKQNAHLVANVVIYGAGYALERHKVATHSEGDGPCGPTLS